MCSILTAKEQTMSDPLEPTEFTIAGLPEFGDRVPVDQFLAAAGDWLDALKATEAALAPRRKAVEWLLTEVLPGSAVAKFVPFPQAADGASIADQLVFRNVVGLNALQRGAEPTTIPNKTVEHLLRLIKRVDDQDVPGISVKRGELYSLIIPRTDMESAPTRPRHSRAIGGVDGVIVSVSFAASPPSFTIRERLDGVLVPCYFDADQHYDAVIENLRQRVSVLGIVTRRADGVAEFMTEIEAIIPVPSDVTLPRPSDLVGIAPDFTDGLSAEKYVRSRRD
jgi:hypothetical protein